MRATASSSDSSYPMPSPSVEVTTPVIRPCAAADASWSGSVIPLLVCPFLAPGETKSFVQRWYLVQRIGPVRRATPDAALSLEPAAAPGGGLVLGVAVTSSRPQARVHVRTTEGYVVWEGTAALGPGVPLVQHLVTRLTPDDLVVDVSDGPQLLVRWVASEPAEASEIVPATEPAAPEAVDSVEELFLVGLHLAQYRHATRSPEPYWREAHAAIPGRHQSEPALYHPTAVPSPRGSEPPVSTPWS